MSTSSMQDKPTTPLLAKIIQDGEMNLSGLQESAWIEVIHKMDEVYADLIHYEVELEEKNSALEEAHKLIASVLSSMSDVLIVCDEKGQIEQVNRALEDLTGKTTTQLLNQSFQVLFADNSQPMMESFPEKIREGGVHDCELGLIARHGEVIPLATNCTSRYDHEGKLVGMVLIGRPVGELKRAYEALHRAHKELQEAQAKLIQSEKMASLGRLVAGVAHELNNPISFVYGNMHSLKRYGERLKTYLTAVHDNKPEAELQTLRDELRIDRIITDLESLIEGTLEGAERTRDIVEDLRRFSTSNRDKSKVFNLSQVVKTAVQWARKGSKQQLIVNYDLSEDIPVQGNAGQIHQVILNLIQNAMDATAEQNSSELNIAAVIENDKVKLVFHDNGPGMSDESLLKVFDPFYTTKPVGQGTGLGLSISYGIIEDHDGKLSANNSPDGGALFEIILPLHAVN